MDITRARELTAAIFTQVKSLEKVLKFRMGYGISVDYYWVQPLLDDHCIAVVLAMESKNIIIEFNLGPWEEANIKLEELLPKHTHQTPVTGIGVTSDKYAIAVAISDTVDELLASIPVKLKIRSSISALAAMLQKAATIEEVKFMIDVPVRKRKEKVDGMEILKTFCQDLQHQIEQAVEVKQVA